MPSKYLRCKTCPQKSTNYNDKWTSHFLTKQHLRPTRILAAQPLTAEKYQYLSVVVYGIVGIPIEMVLRHFAAYTQIRNFVFWGSNPTFCVITVFREQQIEIIRLKNVIDSVELTIRLRESICYHEWIAICPRARRMALQHARLAKELLQGRQQTADAERKQKKALAAEKKKKIAAAKKIKDEEEAVEKEKAEARRRKKRLQRQRYARNKKYKKNAEIHSVKNVVPANKKSKAKKKTKNTV